MSTDWPLAVRWSEELSADWPLAVRWCMHVCMFYLRDTRMQQLVPDMLDGLPCQYPKGCI